MDRSKCVTCKWKIRVGLTSATSFINDRRFDPIDPQGKRQNAVGRDALEATGSFMQLHAVQWNYVESRTHMAEGHVPGHVNTARSRDLDVLWKGHVELRHYRRETRSPRRQYTSYTDTSYTVRRIKLFAKWLSRCGAVRQGIICRCIRVAFDGFMDKIWPSQLYSSTVPVIPK